MSFVEKKDGLTSSASSHIFTPLVDSSQDITMDVFYFTRCLLKDNEIESYYYFAVSLI